uniref:Uncharacterized protein n=1 Tax=Ditylenchus dipsaci TaxID=166011 RepID=A0A915EIQ4_9BILA
MQLPPRPKISRQNSSAQQQKQMDLTTLFKPVIVEKKINVPEMDHMKMLKFVIFATFSVIVSGHVTLEQLSKEMTDVLGKEITNFYDNLMPEENSLLMDLAKSYKNFKTADDVQQYIKNKNPIFFEKCKSFFVTLSQQVEEFSKDNKLLFDNRKSNMSRIYYGLLEFQTTWMSTMQLSTCQLSKLTGT